MLARFAWLAVLALPTTPAAQEPTDDPHTSILRLADRVAEEMRQVDGHLLETAKPADRARRRPQPAVEATKASQERVVRGLEALIDELAAHQRSNCGSGT
jgi:hypothetical protein